MACRSARPTAAPPGETILVGRAPERRCREGEDGQNGDGDRKDPGQSRGTCQEPVVVGE